MEVVLHQDVLLWHAGNDVWKTAARGQRTIDMPFPPQVDWDLHVGSEIAPTRVKKVKYVLRAGHMHVYLEAVKVHESVDVKREADRMKDRGYDVLDL